MLLAFLLRQIDVVERCSHVLNYEHGGNTHMNTLALYTLMAMSLAVIACAVVTYLAHRERVAAVASSRATVEEINARIAQRERELTAQIEQLQKQLEQASMSQPASRILAYLEENSGASKMAVSKALGMSRNTVAKHWPDEVTT